MSVYDPPYPKVSPYLEGLHAYSVPKAPAPTDLMLDANEGAPPPASLLEKLTNDDLERFSRYRRATPLEEVLAEELQTDPAQVLVTAGADEGIQRCCLSYLPENREMIVATPTFEMFPTLARIAGGRMAFVPWSDGPYPVDTVLERIGPDTGIVTVISPNNPTGTVASEDDIGRLSRACPHGLILMDLAYGEFAERDLTPLALKYPNVVVLHTFSKAWGMAGLRIGFAVGSRPVIDVLRTCGTPYPVSNLSLELALEWRKTGRPHVERMVGRIVEERALLSRTLKELGAEVLDSQANFVFCRVKDPLFVRDALAGMGIAVRLVPDEAEFRGGLRITCPGNAKDFERLTHALETVLAPQGILFDMDGVLADVSRSFREAIRQTAETFGVIVSDATISAAKSEPGSNDDWSLTRRLMQREGVEESLETVTETFEHLYQGNGEREGLKARERLIPARVDLEELHESLPLAVVTGRPRKDADFFLQAHDIARFFRTVIAREDAPLKPDPAPVLRALEALSITCVWMLGDTPDDILAARAAGVLPIGVAAPGEDFERRAAPLYAAGAARVISNPTDMKAWLP